MFAKLMGTPVGERLMKPHRGTPTAWGKQLIPKTLIEEGDQRPAGPLLGKRAAMRCPTEDQFKKYTYPIPKEKGGAEIQMLWTDTPCRITCWGCGNADCARP